MLHGGRYPRARFHLSSDVRITMFDRKHAALHREASSRPDANFEPGAKLAIARRQALFHANDPAASLYEVLTGSFMVCRLLADGRRQIVSLVLPGALCGFTHGPLHEYSCEALVPSTVVAYDRAILSTGSEIGVGLAAKMEQEICALSEHIVLLGRRTTEERLAMFLVQCARNWKTASDQNGILFRIPMTRVEIGDYLGMSLETVSRGIASFERRGLIRTGGRQGEMRVFDLDALASARSTQRKVRAHSG
ncbi:MAG: helix-turn-helix domain-containing protein [Alphaproteobacteria bacterium]|nr:helix-turn-helix domain-containing protein [Alphaproteobacteria bacterium]